MKEYPRILSVQDISCLGQCSTTVAMPILSACGCECCLLPTMVLSTHTGGLGSPVRQDLTGLMEPVVTHWMDQGITFDAILVGYLGNAVQVHKVLSFVDRLLTEDGLLIVDPAMADHGRLYSGLDEAYAAAMGALCRRADIMLPNLTEACMLTGSPWQDAEASTDGLLEKLHQQSGGAIVLTGVGREKGMTGAAVFNGCETRYVSHKKSPGSFHGTGDMFAAALTGRLLRGDSLAMAAQKAGSFVQAAIEKTLENPAHGYGVKFERVLPMLWQEDV